MGSTGSTVGNACTVLLERTLKSSSTVKTLSEFSGEAVASCVVGMSKQGCLPGMNWHPSGQAQRAGCCSGIMDRMTLSAVVLQAGGEARSQTNRF